MLPALLGNRSGQAGFPVRAGNPLSVTTPPDDTPIYHKTLRDTGVDLHAILNRPPWRPGDSRSSVARSVGGAVSGRRRNDPTARDAGPEASR